MTSILSYVITSIRARLIAQRAITRKEKTELKGGIFLITVLAAVLAILATLAGCGSNTEKTGAVAGQKSNPVAEQNQMNPQPRDKVQQGGKITWAVDSVIVNFNVDELVDGPSGVGNWVISAMLPQIFVFDARATPSYDPDYLSGEPELTPGPPQVVKYKLNPQAVWSDGSPITAADFIAQWKALRGKDAAFHIAAHWVRSDQKRYAGCEPIRSDRHLRHSLRRLEKPVLTPLSRFHEHSPGDIQYGLEKHYAHECRPLPPGELRCHGQDLHAGPQRKVVGQQAQTGSDYFSRD